MATPLPERVAWREAVVQDIERRGAAFRASGEADRRFSGADPVVRRVAGDFNGPLCEWLLTQGSFPCPDPGALELLRRGAPMVGELPLTGLGTPKECPAQLGEDALRASFATRNAALLGVLHDDPHLDELLGAVAADASQGRMTELQPLEDVALDRILLARRFGVAQGVRADGTTKVRAVDDESFNGVNAA
eukprot:13639314-Alexandrium_andersonii.AAC.1